MAPAGHRHMLEAPFRSAPPDYRAILISHLYRIGRAPSALPSSPTGTGRDARSIAFLPTRHAILMAHVISYFQPLTARHWHIGRLAEMPTFESGRYYRLHMLAFAFTLLALPQRPIAAGAQTVGAQKDACSLSLMLFLRLGALSRPELLRRLRLLAATDYMRDRSTPLLPPAEKRYY